LLEDLKRVWKARITANLLKSVPQKPKTPQETSDPAILTTGSKKPDWQLSKSKRGNDLVHITHKDASEAGY
jgi:hypothetical protein